VPGSNRVIIGAVIAQRSGLIIGDPVTMLIPIVDASGAPTPALRELTVAGTFEVGFQDHDATLMFAHIDDVRALAPSVQAVTGLAHPLQRRVGGAARGRAGARALAGRLRSHRLDGGPRDLLSCRAHREDDDGAHLLLIVAVAAFNIVAMLVMVVTDKRTDIAILRTFGASPRRVMGVFVTQGLVIGWLGVLLGVALGVVLALNVEAIVPVLEHTFRFQIMDADVYYTTSIPSDLNWSNVVWIGAAALALTGFRHALSRPAGRAHGACRSAALRIARMAGAYEWLIGTRYLRSAHRRGFVSFVALISVSGLTLGVATLIVVLSVMNGFERELRTRILSVTAHATLSGLDGALADWRAARAAALRQPGFSPQCPILTSRRCSRTVSTSQARASAASCPRRSARDGTCAASHRGAPERS
jgi:ABC-type lipoprotein release transport system permease subunit